MLLVSGGVTTGSTPVTNQGYAHDPAADAWTALPNSNNSAYRSGSACGFYKVCGNPGGSLVPPVANSEVLPGFVERGGVAADVSWLSESPTSLTLAAGASTTVTVTLDAGVPDVTQPGTLTASLALVTDSGYQVAPISVSRTVNLPKIWGQDRRYRDVDVGCPIAGATVQIDNLGGQLHAEDRQGRSLRAVAGRAQKPTAGDLATDGYQPQVRKVKISKGHHNGGRLSPSNLLSEARPGARPRTVTQPPSGALSF